MFTYPPGMSSVDFSFPDHIPLFVNEVFGDASPEVLDACGDNIQCIFDATQTGDVNIGLVTMQTDGENNENQAIACKEYKITKSYSYIIITLRLKTM